MIALTRIDHADSEVVVRQGSGVFGVRRPQPIWAGLSLSHHGNEKEEQKETDDASANDCDFDSFSHVLVGVSPLFTASPERRRFSLSSRHSGLT